ncbi:uncharacterized protein LOC107266179 [Cephus cinctus]|uniref:Uncharacterized protein LOC107266179 n=1 Tax=Cephus cinctus TaxID=211228 RepID=A0AAJ7FHC9_CEPCN|nr:uncharacterized protein LOC107266179 [Cephus cinctus]
MDRKVAVLAVVFALAVGSDGAVKCYMCNTATNSSCGDDIMNSKFKAVECTNENIIRSNAEISSNPLLKQITDILETDTPQQGDIASPDKAACGKMNVMVGDRKVTIRNCQIAKTESVDPCSTIQKKLTEKGQTSNTKLFPTLDFCNVCEKDACNGKMGMVPKAFYMIFPVVTALALGNGNYMA